MTSVTTQFDLTHSTPNTSATNSTLAENYTILNMDPTNNTKATNITAFATTPRFVRAVYEVLQHEDQRILSWPADGSPFQIYDVPRVEAEALRKYFKHDKFSSFQRQINNFGFHKWTKTRANVAMFSHDVLVRCPLSQLDVSASRMKQETERTTLAKTPTLTKRRRNHLSTGTTSERIVDVKRLKLSPGFEVAVVARGGWQPRQF